MPLTWEGPETWSLRQNPLEPDGLPWVDWDTGLPAQATWRGSVGAGKQTLSVAAQAPGHFCLGPCTWDPVARPPLPPWTPGIGGCEVPPGSASPGAPPSSAGGLGICALKSWPRSSCCGAVEANLASIHEDAGLIPDLA